MTIRTNNQPRALKCLFEFSLKNQAKIKSDFDWLEDIESDCGFFDYRGRVFNLSTFLRVSANNEPDHDFYGWHGVDADSYFSATLVKICPDNDFVIVGRWFS